MSKYVERTEKTLSHLQLQARDNLCNQEIAHHGDQVAQFQKLDSQQHMFKSRHIRLSGVQMVTKYGCVCARVALLPLR